jgi:hypothetical protein
MGASRKIIGIYLVCVKNMHVLAVNEKEKARFWLWLEGILLGVVANMRRILGAQIMIPYEEWLARWS